MQAVFTEWLEYGFMKNALLAVLIITPLFGILGTMIVNKKMAFFSDSLGHSALTGIAIGAVLGMKDTTLSMILFAIVFALLLNKIAEKSTASTDTLISVFSSASMALGLAILSKGGNFSKYSALLVGDILSITRREILYLVAIFAVTLVFWVLAFNKLCAESVNVTLAKSKGIPVKVIENLFSILIALIVMLSIKWIGILLICTVDPAGSIRPEYFAEYEGISFLFCGIFHFFRSAGTSGVVLYKCCDRSDDRVDRIGDLLFYLCLWTEVCVVNKDPFKEYVKQSEPGKRDKGYAWHTAIGLQAVDGLQPSQYLLDTAIET